MPITPPTIAGVVAPAIAASGMLGISAPQLALGIGIGLSLFTQAATVVSVDTGTLGVGNTSAPFVVPQPLILGGMLSGFAAQALVGPMAAPLAAGLATGIATGLLQGLLVIVHPTVGVGVGVTRIVPAGSAVPMMAAGLASAGFTGTAGVRIGAAVGIALDIAFSSFTLPLPIVGAPSPVGSAGVGAGKIV